MAPQRNLLGRHKSENASQSSQGMRTTEPMARSADVERIRNEESWVEISSQPSSSSVSSIGDEIITTGLRVQHDPNTLRARRRVLSAASPRVHLGTGPTSTSSQEEYDESESDEDHVMSSSNENIPSSTLSTVQPNYDDGSDLDDDDDDDENATALGRRTETEPAFTPQPNAFSHPPSSQATLAPGSYFPRAPQPVAVRPSTNSRTQTHPQKPYYQADHDAALRASLTTLLSIGAAAARSLPKRDHGPTIPSNEPMNIRLVPESEVLGTRAPCSSRPLSPSTRARSSPSVSSQEAIEKGKRKAGGAKPAGERARVAKKKKVTPVGEVSISPTLLSWVLSAGVVVLVSVVGFGAGYVIGREVGRQEALAGLNASSVLADGGSCSGEFARSSGTLKKFRWGGGVARSVVA